MTRFIIYSCLNNSRSNVLATKSIETTKPHLHQHHQMGQPIGLIDCQQIVREPTSQLETKSLYTNHHTIEIVPLSSSQTYDDQSDDSCSILLESNLVCLHISLTGQQTLELQFNLGLERFFLIGSPNVKLLLCGILRLHQPCLEVLYGLTQCHLTGNTAIHVNDIVIDIYSKFERFERLSDRRRLAYSFFQLVPKLYDSNRMLMSNHGIENKMSETNSANFLIYFRMNEHRRPVALFEGELHCSPTETYKRFECESQLYPQKQFPEINSSLEVCVIMNELQNQHRKFILKHSNLSTIVITGLETQCHVFGLRKPYFSFNLGSIKIAGYLVVRDRQQNGSNQLVSGQGEVVIKNGSAILYIDDYFAILTINSENAEHEIVQSFNKEKEFKSISLMNCNKRRQTIESLESFVGNITEQIDDSLKQLPVIEVSPDTDNVIEDSFRLSQLNQITLILTKDSPSASLKLFANRGIGYELSLQSNDSICLTMNGKLLNINQILNQSKPLTIEYFLEKWANRSNRNEWSNDATISGKIIISIHNGTLSVLILAPELFILFDPREVNGESNSVDSILKFYCHRNGSEQLVIDPIVRSLNASTTTGTLDTTNETVTTNEKDKQEKDGLHTKLKSDGNSNNLKSNKKKKKKKSRTKEKKKQHKYKPKLCKTSLTNFKFFKTGKYDGIHLEIKADRSKPKIISKPKECIQTDPYCGIDIISFGHESSTAKSPILANIIAERATYLFYYEEKTKRTPFGLFDGELGLTPNRLLRDSCSARIVVCRQQKENNHQTTLDLTNDHLMIQLDPKETNKDTVVRIYGGNGSNGYSFNRGSLTLIGQLKVIYDHEQWKESFNVDNEPTSTNGGQTNVLQVIPTFGRLTIHIYDFHTFLVDDSNRLKNYQIIKQPTK